MIIDSLTEFASAVSVANAAGTDLIGDVYNLQHLRDAAPVGKPIYLVIQAAADILTGGAAGTIKFQLASDAAAAIATDGSATVHFETPTFVTDGQDANELHAGDTIAVVALPREAIKTYEQYIGILAVTATTTITAGSINAFLTLDPPYWKSYPDAVN